MKILQWRKMLQKALWTVMAVYGKTSPPLACVKLPVLKLVFTLKSFNVSMVQGLQWFLRTRFSPLLSQEEEQQSSSVFQINTSLDTCESLNKPWRIYFMSQSVLALGFTGPSWAREQIPEAGMRDGGEGEQDAASDRRQAQPSVPYSHRALHVQGYCWKVWEGTDSLLGRDPSFSQGSKDSSKQT